MIPLSAPNLVESFRKDYVGQATEALVEYLTDANKLFYSEGLAQVGISLHRRPAPQG